MRLMFKSGNVECEIELLEEVAPITVAEISKSLPIRSVANRWGDEIYFTTGIEVDVEENSMDAVELGDVAYWIPGKAICLFFGKTPISDDRIRPASAVNVIGRIVGDLESLKKVNDGDAVLLDRKYG